MFLALMANLISGPLAVLYTEWAWGQSPETQGFCIDRSESRSRLQTVQVTTYDVLYIVSGSEFVSLSILSLASIVGISFLETTFFFFYDLRPPPPPFEKQ